MGIVVFLPMITQNVLLVGPSFVYCVQNPLYAIFVEHWEPSMWEDFHTKPQVLLIKESAGGQNAKLSERETCSAKWNLFKGGSHK